MNLLKTDGTMILVGAPDKPTPLEPFPLILHRRSIAGSVIGASAKPKRCSTSAPRTTLSPILN